MSEVRAGVLGAGFIGAVHVEALRRIGVEVAGIVSSTEGSYDDLLADDTVRVIHITTPNSLHYAQAKAALAAGKHVVCEKPLATTSQESAELLELARVSGLVHCTNFNIRFYPQVQHARSLVRAGTVGDVWNAHGGYLQDWLQQPTDWNWRLEPEQGGELRAVADIGSHWLDTVQFVTDKKVANIFADLATAIPVRRRPNGEVRTFAAADDTERVDVPMATEDFAHVLLRFDDGSRGSFVVSQVSAGRKNSLRFELDGSDGSVAWDSERNEELWLGHRDRPSETVLRAPAFPGATLPAGHAEGFENTFKQLYRAVYRAVAAGGMPDEPDFPTFEDGHRENVLGDAIAQSNREQRWIEVMTT